MAPKRNDNKRRDDMGIDSVTRKLCSKALRTDRGGPDDGASGTQHAMTHHESARLDARASEAKRLRAFTASASVSVPASPPQMPGPAAAHRLDSSPTLSFSVSPVQAVMLGTTGTYWVTRKRRSDVLGTGRRGPGGGASAMQHTMTHHTPQGESARLEARAREAMRLRAFAASASAFVSAPPQMPRPAAAHQLNSPPMSTSSFTVSAAQAASILEEFHAAYGTQPVQQARDQEDHPRQQQRWGDHFIDVADAGMLAAGYAGMLLDESLHEQQAEIEKKYWEGIMHLVNSPLETSVAATPAAAEASSSSAAASSSTSSAAVPAPTLIQRGTSDPSRPA